MAMSACSSGRIAGNPASALAGRNHLPDSPTRGSASALGASVALTAPAAGSAPAWGSASSPVTPCSASASASVACASASGVRGSPSAPAASGATPASVVPGSVSASPVMSLLPPEAVLRSSASDLAPPSSVAGRDGTRLKYRPGLAFRANSRVVRKCPPFLACARVLAIRIPASRRAARASSVRRAGARRERSLDPRLRSRLVPGRIGEDPGLREHLVHYIDPHPSQEPHSSQKPWLGPASGGADLPCAPLSLSHVRL